MTIDECAHIEELLSAMQDGAVTPEERARAGRHINGCARCQATAAAFGQVDRQVRRYLMATPVPEIGAPWRTEPLVLPQRRGTSAGHWRVTAVGLAAIFVMLLTASILTFRPFANNQQQSASIARPTVAADTSGGAPAAAPAASSAPAARQSASAAPTAAAAAAAIQSAPTREAARSANSAAPATAAAAGGAAATGTRQQAPMAAGGVAQFNPTQLFQLADSASLTVCRPDCETQPQPEALRATVVASLNRPLTTVAPSSPTAEPERYLTLRFTLKNGQQVDIGYYPQAQRLQLPNGRGLVVSPPELATALAEVIPPR